MPNNNNHHHQRDVTVIVAAAGPVSIPSWTLPLQDGRPALTSVVERLNCSKSVSRFIFVCLQEHVEKYFPPSSSATATPPPSSSQILRNNNNVLTELLESMNPELKGRVEIFQLPEPTKSGVETITKTIKEFNITGGIFIKDADGAFDFEIPSASAPNGGSYVVCLKIHDNTVNTLSELTRKSFVQQCGGILTNIVEKKIISDSICVGGYGFESACDYVKHAEKLEKQVPTSFYDASESRKPGVLFNSDIILSLLAEQEVVSVKFVESFSDWKSASGVVKFKDTFTNVVVSFEEDLCERNQHHAFNAVELMTNRNHNNDNHQQPEGQNSNIDGVEEERILHLLKQLYTIKPEMAKKLRERGNVRNGNKNKIVILTALSKRLEGILGKFLKDHHQIHFDQIVSGMFSSAACTKI